MSFSYCMSISNRNKTSTYILYYVCTLLILSRLKLCSTSKAIVPFEERSHVAVWKWVQRFRPNKIYVRKRVVAFVIDENNPKKKPCKGTVKENDKNMIHYSIVLLVFVASLTYCFTTTASILRTYRRLKMHMSSPSEWRHGMLIT